MTFIPRPDESDAVDRLADTLAALVSGVAAGLVGDAVIVADRAASAGASSAWATVAEATGAILVLRPAGLDPYAAGARAARRDWVLCLEAGDVPAEGWIRTLDRFVGTARPEAGLGRLARSGAGLGARVAARLERLRGASAARAGDVARRDLLAAGNAFAPRLPVCPLIGRLERA